MSCHSSGSWRPRFWCRERDVLEAFRATAAGIRSLIQSTEEHLDTEGARYLADRIREQRDLVHQILAHRHFGRAKRLLRINRRLRNRFLTLAGAAGLPMETLRSQCRIRTGGTIIP